MDCSGHSLILHANLQDRHCQHHELCSRGIRGYCAYLDTVVLGLGICKLYWSTH